MAKYVIDIDELDYETIKEVDELSGSWKTDIASRNMKAIANATPLEKVLEDIKAEIVNKAYEYMSNSDYNDGVRFGLMLALQIVKKHTNGKESD